MVIKIEIYELLKAYSMQKKCFKPIYEKILRRNKPPAKSHLQNFYQEQQSRVFKCIDN